MYQQTKSTADVWCSRRTVLHGDAALKIKNYVYPKGFHFFRSVPRFGYSM